MKIGIIGAGNMARFHAREFVSQGCELVAVLDSDKSKAEEFAKEIEKIYNQKTKAFSDKEDFFKESLNVVSICTPPEFHYKYIKEALLNKLNVFCEKPLVFENKSNNFPLAKELVELSNKNNVFVEVNTQWPAVFDYLPTITEKITSFEMYMEPGVKEIDMLKEHLAHMNSMIIHLLPNGKAENIKFLDKNKESISVSFDYIYGENICKVLFNLKYKENRPREVEFKINSKKFFRKIAENYKQTIICENNEYEIEDLLKISIKEFVEAVKSKDNGKLLITSNNLLRNIELQDQIIKEYLL